MLFSRTVSDNSDVVGYLGQVRYDLIKGDDLAFVTSMKHGRLKQVTPCRTYASWYVPRPGEAHGSRARRLFYDEPRTQIIRFQTGMSLCKV